MTEAPLKKPYGVIFHPFRTWLDIILSFIVSLILPLQSLAKLPATEDNDKTTAANGKIRTRMGKLSPMEGKGWIAKWAKGLAEETDIVEATLAIPRRPILTEWEIHHESLQEKMPKHDILITVRMPLSVCGVKGSLASTGKNEFGCRTLESIDLSDLPKSLPFVVFFHGGGLTLGSRNDAEGIALAVSVSLAAEKPLIFASVEYSLAPTHPFPAAPAESLTVMAYLMEKLPDRKFHIMGASAGGGIAAVAGLEVFRRFPGKVASLVPLIPMLDPAADSESYYMNSKSSQVCPVDWLRWCWRCYLELPPSGDQGRVLELPSMVERFAHGSNQRTWAASPWRQFPSLTRLVNPMLDLPPGLDGKAAPPILVHTNRADPLRDDGVRLYQLFRERGANVQHIEHMGSHWLGTKVVPKSYDELIQAWKDMVFA
jgi:acetyl esterase/lipase